MRSFTTEARRHGGVAAQLAGDPNIGNVGELQSEPFLTMISVSPCLRGENFLARCI